MPFRSQRTLEGWLEEFRAEGHTIPGSVKVMQQDGEGGTNTGLVGVRFANSSTITYIQPEAPYAMKWVVTMEGREESITLDAEAVAELARELMMVSALCDFLQVKSSEFTGVDHP